MRILVILSFFVSLSALGQDTLRYDDLIIDESGKTVKTSYRSGVTGAKQTIYLKKGKWLYYDAYGEVIKEVEYKSNRRDKSYVKHGYEVYLNPDTYDTILIRRYNKGQIKEQMAFENSTILDKGRIISTYRDFGDFTVQEYGLKPNRTDFVSVWMSTIEDPSAIEDMSNYSAYEDSLGDPSLLEPASHLTLSQFNYIQNPEFEVHPKAPFSIVSFTNQIPYWIEASKSPDFFISHDQARSGNSFIGFRVFTMEKHIEYVQNKLKAPLKKDSTYCFSAYLKLSPGSKYATNAIGIQFTDERNSIDVDQLLEVTADIELQDQLLIYKTRWMKIQCTYQAKGGEQWMTIGSFKDHLNLELHEVPGSTAESYYYLDDVSLVPIEVAQDCPCNFNREKISDQELDEVVENEELELLNNLKEGENLVLRNIHFENDRSTLLPTSFSSLYNVLSVLNKNPNMRIEISGHTSQQGGLDHNMRLSMDRAQAVRNFLTLNGIDGGRIEVQGHGPQFPIASNATEEGQSQNRRVEFKVLEL
jgi:outer membrane protein OmpA-like peptidoglycan-associated protein